ncbi:MAG TPA: ubiquinone/menaquinone biosynthesis methyltransferase [Thermoanaerobaculia bacterium]|nr:ubiquinone/menaquinone biosynthesis methyltransferase [Thermoanaerobaculia bacterium]
MTRIDKSPGKIRDMFAEIAPTYDRANRLLSLRLDVIWRRRALRNLLPAPGRVLDLASGTGDLALELCRLGHEAVSADFTLEMMLAGREKVARRGIPQITADALALPFAAGSFDAITVAFGIRNFQDPLVALEEMKRVIRPGGRVMILELSNPSGILARPYAWYFGAILPRLGGLISGSPSAYRYLPTSVGDFPQGERFLALMRDAGFVEASAVKLSGGIATIYLGETP